jgi:glycosyltransferase involved in cell wall biosynthesis
MINSHKIKNLHLVESMDDSYGGPAKSIPLLCANIDDELFDVEIHSLKCLASESNYFCEMCSVKWVAYESFCFKKLSISLSLILRLCKELLKNKYLIIHTHNFWNFVPLSAFLSKLFFNKKVILVMSVRGSLRRNSLKKKIVWNIFQKKMIQMSDAIHVTNMNDYNYIVKYNHNVKYIPNGVYANQLSNYKMDCEKNFLPKVENRCLLYLSRIHEDKGLKYLADAWIALSSKYQEWDLIVAGYIYDEPYFNNIVSQIEASQLTSRFHYLGALSPLEVGCVYGFADVFILPTKGENFGLSIAEALSFGLPVITTNRTPWLSISENNAGYIIELNDEELGECMDRIMSLSDNQLKIMGGNAKEVVKGMTWENVGELTSLEYQRVISDLV